MSHASFSCFRLTLIIIVLFGFTVGTAHAGIVPELTGSSIGYASFSAFVCDYDFPGTVVPGGGSFSLGNGSIGFGVSSTETSVTGFYGTDSLGVSFCHFFYSGTTDGPITGTFTSPTLTLTFTGTATGTYEGGSNNSINEFDWNGNFVASFTGLWSNGWYSTGGFTAWRQVMPVSTMPTLTSRP